MANNISKKYFIGISLIFSLIAYGSIHQYNLIFLSLIIFLNYFGASLLCSRYRSKILLFALISINLCLLIGIKTYFRNEETWLSSTDVSSLVFFGMGSSFYILQAIGYLVDVYYEKKLVEKNIFIFSLYICFFPQMIMGPIERSYHLIKEFKEQNRPTFEVSKDALLRIFLGFFKKSVFADNLYQTIAPVINNFDQYDPLSNIFCIIFFFLAFYAGFSGYTDIAIGTSRLVGIKLNENFNNPLASKNVFDFFARWNVTLYSWLKDYVVYPIQKTYFRNLSIYSFVIIAFLSALWHQLSWPFFLWGLFMCVGFPVYKYMDNKLTSKGAQTLFNYFFLYFGGFIAFIFFVSTDISSIASFFNAVTSLENWHRSVDIFKSIGAQKLISFALLGAMLLTGGLEKRDLRFGIKKKPFRILIYLLMITLFVLLRPTESIIFTYNRL